MLIVCRKPNLPTSLDLSVPVPQFPVIESDYDQALERELKEARAVAKKNVEAAQQH